MPGGASGVMRGLGFAGAVIGAALLAGLGRGDDSSAPRVRAGSDGEVHVGRDQHEHAR
jgi:hypothetical protein